MRSVKADGPSTIILGVAKTLMAIENMATSPGGMSRAMMQPIARTCLLVAEVGEMPNRFERRNTSGIVIVVYLPPNDMEFSGERSESAATTG
jgi:hypothetical protein